MSHFHEITPLNFTFYLFKGFASATFLLVCFAWLKEDDFGARKNVFYFTSKALFILEVIRF